MTARAPEIDVVKLLGLAGPGAWALAVLYGVTFVTLATLSNGPPMATPQGWIALAAVLAAAAVLVLPGRYPLALPTTIATIVVVVFVNIAILWQLSPIGWPGWSSWNFGASHFLMFAVALRGRIAWGLLGMLLMSAIAIHWTLTTTGDGWHGFNQTYRQLATYAAGAFFAFWLRRTTRQTVAFQDAERRRSAQEVALTEGARERELELEQLRRRAVPALERILEGGLSDAERLEHGLLEAELRDHIRGRALADGPLPVAARAARRRGIQVVVLDDAGDAPLVPERLAESIAWAAGKIDQARSGTVTVRLGMTTGGAVVTVALDSEAGEPDVFEL